MGLWDKEGIPHKGWNCIDRVDNEAATETCQMCGKKKIRFLHIMQHKNYNDLAVGCECAAKMAEDYNSKEAEQKLKNIANRKLTFMKKWYQNINGNNVYKIKKGKYITISRKNNRFEICIGGVWHDTFDGKCFIELEQAKKIAFKLHDRHIHPKDYL